MKKNPAAIWGQAAFILIVVFSVVVALPSGKAFSDDGSPQPETGRSLDPILHPTQEQNNDMTRGIVWTGLLMVTVVIVGTLTIMEVDQKNNPHLIRKKKKKTE